MEMNVAREVAARVWCDPEMSSVPMDAGLAEIIALLVQRAAQQLAEEADRAAILASATGPVLDAIFDSMWTSGRGDGYMLSSEDYRGLYDAARKLSSALGPAA